MIVNKKPSNDNKPLFPISVVADILGIHERTLMLYEYERLVIPKRSKTNRRMYSQKEIRTLKFLRYLTTKKKVNYAGIRIIMEMIKEAKHKDIDLRAMIFPNYKDKI